jgi:hypothetical protein
MTSARSLAFAAAVRVIDRIHGYTAIVRTLSQPTGSAGFAERYVFMLDISDLAHSRHAL